jgi:hypothetical protein
MFHFECFMVFQYLPFNGELLKTVHFSMENYLIGKYSIADLRKDVFGVYSKANAPNYSVCKLNSIGYFIS